ncbi:hypothetical protein CH63R_13804 [Colletotrichum higginsianum IMI 349063]|uniref:Uncharacterized protein n=1 Tax=Colletotrichum higginsianum (strain IMI 349063) TaxID=759273 RepID=A0A1B7XS15_COLHI|nr:hypothetical protein CH63R_13804 [Colletotrichum higginsianum IMI 349063]OBR02578.1 hypothetical protein CH63R_13804 [Colletotrichum higginsianum IMI 349063]
MGSGSEAGQEAPGQEGGGEEDGEKEQGREEEDGKEEKTGGNNNEEGEQEGENDNKENEEDEEEEEVEEEEEEEEEDRQKEHDRPGSPGSPGGRPGGQPPDSSPGPSALGRQKPQTSHQAGKGNGRRPGGARGGPGKGATSTTTGAIGKFFLAVGSALGAQKHGRQEKADDGLRPAKRRRIHPAQPGRDGACVAKSTGTQSHPCEPETRTSAKRRGTSSDREQMQVKRPRLEQRRGAE